MFQSVGDEPEDHGHDTLGEHSRKTHHTNLLIQVAKRPDLVDHDSHIGAHYTLKENYEEVFSYKKLVLVNHPPNRN